MIARETEQLNMHVHKMPSIYCICLLYYSFLYGLQVRQRAGYCMLYGRLW